MHFVAQFNASLIPRSIKLKVKIKRMKSPTFYYWFSLYAGVQRSQTLKNRQQSHSYMQYCVQESAVAFQKDFRI